MSEEAQVELDSTEGAAADRLNQQCFLVDNFPTYANARHNLKGFGGNFSAVMGNPTDVLQALTTKPGREAFLGLTSEKFALLVPTIRIFRTPVDSLSKKVLSGSAKKREISFKTFISDQSIASMTSSRGMRGDQVGLKEMTYELVQGGDAATSRKRQIVTIKFIADSLAAVQRTGVADLILYPKRRTYKFDEKGKSIAGKDIPNSDYYAVQITYGWTAPKNTTAMAYTAAELKAIAQSVTTLTLSLTGRELSFNEDGSVELEAKYEGYVDSKLDGLSTNILYSSESSKTAIADQRKAVDAAELKREAAEALEKKKKKELQERTDALNDFEKERTDAEIDRDAQKFSDAAKDANNAEEATKEYHRKEDDQDLKLKQLVEADRQEKYNRVLNNLSTSGKIWHIDVDPEAIGRVRAGRSWSNDVGTQIRGGDPNKEKPALTGDVSTKKVKAALTPEEYSRLNDEQKEKYDKDQAAQSVASAFTSPAPEPKKGGDAQVIDKAKAATAKHAKNKVQEMSIKHQEEQAAREDMDLDFLNTAAKEKTASDLDNFNTANQAKASPTDGKVRINYMYWGDIFNEVLRTAYRGKKLPIRYLVGTLNFRDPRTASPATVNLADIPISLNLFTTWWLKKIVAPGKDVYTIKEFIKDSINELVVAALGADCFEGAYNFGTVGGNAATEPPRISFTAIAAPLGAGQKDRIANKGRVSLAGDDFQQYVSSQKNGNLQWRGPENQVEYIFIYCNAWTKSNLRGNYAEDKKKGIYHIYVGQDRGPVKKISFERDDEMSDLMETDASMKAQGISQLVAAYSAKMDMVGNTIWTPGNYVFISPSALGISAAAASAMGLGGYYTVTDVSGKIDSGGWSSELKALPLFTTTAERAGAKLGGTTQSLDSLSDKNQNKSPENK
jgi:hypothetical protein